MLTSSLAQMDRFLDEWETTGDRRAVFIDCYARMTRAMCGSIERAEYDDAAWVGEMLERFAAHYFGAVESWEQRGVAPDPWAVAFSAAAAVDRSTLQLLLAGVNAHINYDLVLTLVELLDPVWADLDGDALDSRRRDFDRVNDVIAATADEVQDLVVERHAPSLDIADRLLGRADEWMAVRLLSSWRDEVWCQAASILDLERDARPPLVERRARRCARRGRLILLRA